MRIEDILKENQPTEYKKLKDKPKKREKLSHAKANEELTERDIKELMSHSSYKRKNGYIRQVR